MRGFLKNIKFVWGYAKGEKGKILIYSLLSILNIFESIVVPILSARMIVDLTSNNLEQFIFIGVVILVTELLSDVLQYFRNKLYEEIFREIYISLQTDLGVEILKLNNKTLEEKGTGVFIQRLVGDTKSISTIFTDINRYLNGIISNIGVIITFFILSKAIFVFVLIAFTTRMIIEIVRINIRNKKEKGYRKNNDAMTGFVGEIVRGAEDIKMLNGENSFLDELKIRFKKLNKERYDMQNINMSFLLFRWIIADICSFIIICIIAKSISVGSMSVAVGMVIFNLSGRYNNLVQNIIGFVEHIKHFNLSATRVFDIYVDSEYEKESFGCKHLEQVNGDFEFKNVTFKYDENIVLKKASFKVNANETVAFVGKSGAGKTTIFNLLCKMYDNYTGKITIDGVNIRDLDKDSIRGNITIVSQNPYIFNMSIRDNLKLVKDTLTDEEMKNACKLACLEDYIESLPDKYDTIVGEGGINLSGGQKQRLAIARAFVQKTEIILFDEATSALDNETQLKIQQAIDNLQKDYTILIIAHRLSTIKNADRILVLDEGKIVAEGKHEDLLKECSQYKKLYNTEILKKDD